jgi:hypothetical protein
MGELYCEENTFIPVDLVFYVHGVIEILLEAP